jgi:hypothetical protein
MLDFFPPTRAEVIGKWRRLHNEEFHDLYSSPNIIRVIKSRISWVGNVARMEDRYIGSWWGHLRERDHLDEVGMRIILNWIFSKWDKDMDWIDLPQNR